MSSTNYNPTNPTKKSENQHFSEITETQKQRARERKQEMLDEARRKIEKQSHEE
jgi:hypothetical protein